MYYYNDKGSNKVEYKLSIYIKKKPIDGKSNGTVLYSYKGCFFFFRDAQMKFV